MNKSKDLGTRAEKAVVDYLKANGWPAAERRALNGSTDRGDVTGTPGLCWEVKYRKDAPGDGQITAWMTETETERANDGADLGILVVRRNSFGGPRAGSWWAIVTVDAVRRLVGDPFYNTDHYAQPVRMLLADLVGLLRAAGYGDPLEAL